MAGFSEELPNDLIKSLIKLEDGCNNMVSEMVEAGADVVYKNIKANMQSSFKTTKSLNKGLKKTKVYKTPSDDGVNVHIGFYGYDPDSKPTEKYPKGTPIALIAYAREYGTSNGEQKNSFLRKSFKKKEIEQEMLKVQGKYIEGD